MRTSFFSLLILFLAFDAQAADRQPNILIILSDDQGWGDLSSSGNTNLKTPHIDSLARDGAKFDRFFVSPVCAPTRAELLTGRFHPRTGVWGVSRGEERLNLDEKTIADMLKEGGYRTGNFGKWHNGTQYPYHPNGRGFDEYYGFTSGHWGHYFSPLLEHNGKAVKGNGYVTDDFSEQAMKFMEDSKDNPFFCYVTYCTPHTPFQITDEFYDRFKDKTFDMEHRDPEKEEIGRTRAALSMVENIDWNVGRMLEKLDDLDIADDTIVIYFSDNGPNSWRWNDDMKGRKGSTDEGGVRVPCYVRWPKKIPAGHTIEGIAGAIDFMPTLSEMTGVPIRGMKMLDGISQAKQLMSLNAPKPNDRFIFSQRGGRISARTNQYRLDQNGALFDMLADPGQRNDISKQHGAITRMIQGAIDEFREETWPDGKPASRPFTVGYKEFPVTVLPARDAIATGDIERSNRAPNCSFFTNWVNTEDTVGWNIAVNEPGNYAVTVYYTCPEKELGSTFQVTADGEKVSGKITEAHDPPLVGESDDRFPRGTESFVKEFKPLMIGNIALKSGGTLITVQPTEIAGSQVMDIRGITLELL